jgi:hypothetical protein
MTNKSGNIRSREGVNWVPFGFRKKWDPGRFYSCLVRVCCRLKTTTVQRAAIEEQRTGRRIVQEFECKIMKIVRIINEEGRAWVYIHTGLQLN